MTVAALEEKFDVHPNQITQWKTQLLENASGVFATVAEKQAVGPDLKDLHAKFGQAYLTRLCHGWTTSKTIKNVTPIFC